MSTKPRVSRVKRAAVVILLLLICASFFAAAAVLWPRVVTEDVANNCYKGGGSTLAAQRFERHYVLGIFVDDYIKKAEKENRCVSLPNEGISIRTSTDTLYVSDDRYIKLIITVRNNSDHPIWFPPIGSCASYETFYVDTTNPDSDDGSFLVCAIGFPPLYPGESYQTVRAYNPINLDPGLHTIQFSANGVKSNILTLNILPGITSVANCYNYTVELTPLCKNLKLETNYGGSYRGENARRCNTIKKNFINGSPLQPIPVPGKSNLSCKEDRPAYFIMNIPPSEAKIWSKRISDYNENVWYRAEISRDFFIDYPKL